MLAEATFWLCSGFGALALMAVVEAVYTGVEEFLKGDE